MDKIDNPLQDPEQPAVGIDGTPKFGRLLIVLVGVVLLIVGITFASVRYYQ